MTRSRWTIPLVLAVTVFVHYLDRNNLAIVLPQIAREFGWDDRQIGQHGNLLLGAFYLTFGIAQVILSPLAERWGVKRSLMASVAGFSVCTMLFYPLGGSLGALIALRLLLGAAESVHMPMNSALVGRWFAPHERGRANAIYVAGILVALAVAPLIVVPLAERFGWRATFLLLGAAGMAISLPLAARYISDQPPDWQPSQRRGCACALPTRCGHTARATRSRSGYTWWRACATPSACSAS
jgi:MFS family permease